MGPRPPVFTPLPGVAQGLIDLHSAQHPGRTPPTSDGETHKSFWRFNFSSAQKVGRRAAVPLNLVCSLSGYHEALL